MTDDDAPKLCKVNESRIGEVEKTLKEFLYGKYPDDENSFYHFMHDVKEHIKACNRKNKFITWVAGSILVGVITGILLTLYSN